MQYTRSDILPVVTEERLAYHADAGIEGWVANVLKLTDAAGDNVKAYMESLRHQLDAQAERAAQTVTTAATAEGARHTRKWVATVSAGANIDVGLLVRDDDLIDLLGLKSQETVSLIKNLSGDMADRIERLALGSILEGRSNAETAKLLSEIEGIGQRRAQLIARDQASKLNGAMNQYRQEQAGVTKYIWRTVIDGRERPSHHANNGKTFEWEKPPPTGAPGQAINCRCRASALIEDDEDEDEDLDIIEPEELPPVPTQPEVPNGPHWERGPEIVRPLDDALSDGRSLVLNEGRRTGNEWAYVHDLDGKHLATISTGKGRSVQIGHEGLPEIYSAKQRLVVHHNHPPGGSFSPADTMVFYPMEGMDTLYAHAHDGSLYRLRVPDRARIIEFTAAAEERVRTYVVAAYDRGDVSFDDGNALASHIRMLALARKGLVDYHFELAGSAASAARRNAEFIEKAVADVAAHIPD